MRLMLLVDGDRRWARERNLPVSAGYQTMATKIAMCCQYFLKIGIEEVFIPVCSVGNLQREPNEVKSFLENFLQIPKISTVPLDVSISGNLSLLSNEFQKRYIEMANIYSSGFPVTFLVAWSLDDEILRIVNRFRLSPHPVTAQSLAVTSDISGTIDLIIRTGKVWRLSSFIPFLSPYAELFSLIFTFQISQKMIWVGLSPISVSDSADLANSGASPITLGYGGIKASPAPCRNHEKFFGIKFSGRL